MVQHVGRRWPGGRRWARRRLLSDSRRGAPCFYHPRARVGKRHAEQLRREHVSLPRESEPRGTREASDDLVHTSIVLACVLAGATLVELSASLLERVALPSSTHPIGEPAPPSLLTTQALLLA